MKKIIFLLMVSILIVSCSQSMIKEGSGAYSPNPGQVSSNVNTDSQSKTEEAMKYVTIETDKGKIKAELYTKEAPITTKNFIELASSGFYNGLTFHRIKPGFVAQGGDPKGDGTGGSGKSIQLEINPKLTHVKGALGMARTQDPNSATSQFYITLEAAHFLDGNYAVFGKVTEGMEIAQKLEKGDKMNKVYITDK